MRQAAVAMGGRSSASRLLLLLAGTAALLCLMSNPVESFNGPQLNNRPSTRAQQQPQPLRMQQQQPQDQQGLNEVSRAGAVLGQVGGALAALGALGGLALTPLPAGAAPRELEYMPGIEGQGYGKKRQVYPDFVQSPTGLQYKDVREGKGNSPQSGDRVVVDWEGAWCGVGGWFGGSAVASVWMHAYTHTHKHMHTIYDSKATRWATTAGCVQILLASCLKKTFGACIIHCPFRSHGHPQVFEAKGKTKGGAFDATVRISYLKSMRMLVAHVDN